jgi:Bacterial PH domain
VRTYRSPLWALVIQTTLAGLMALLGLSIAIHPGNAGHPGTAPGYVAFGAALAAIMILVAVVQIRARLVVSELGLSWRYVMRTRSVPWADIQDVLVVPAASLGSYCSPAVKVGGNLVRIDSVVGPRRYTEHIVSAIRAAGQRLEPSVGC